VSTDNTDTACPVGTCGARDSGCASNIQKLDVHGNIPTFTGITDGKVPGIRMLDQIVPETGAILNDSQVPSLKNAPFTATPAIATPRLNFPI
jgi:hypothetical protein